MVVIDSFIKSEVEESEHLKLMGPPLLRSKYIAKALGYAKLNNAISSHCKATLKQGIATKQGNATFHS